MIQERFDQTPLALTLNSNDQTISTFSESSAALLVTLQKAQEEMSEQIRILREIQQQSSNLCEGGGASPVKVACSPHIAVRLEEAIKRNDETIALTKKAVEASKHVITDVLKESSPQTEQPQAPENLSAMLDSVKQQVQGLKEYFDQLRMRLMESEQREYELRKQIEALHRNRGMVQSNMSQHKEDEHRASNDVVQEIASYFPPGGHFASLFLN